MQSFEYWLQVMFLRFVDVLLKVIAFLRGGPAVLDGCVQESTVFDTVCMVSDTF